MTEGHWLMTNRELDASLETALSELQGRLSQVLEDGGDGIRSDYAVRLDTLINEIRKFLGRGGSRDTSIGAPWK